MFNLRYLLLYTRRVTFLDRRFCNVLRTRIRLLLGRFVTNLHAFRFLYNNNMTLLNTINVRPRNFSNLMRHFLIIRRIRFTNLLLGLNFLCNALNLPITRSERTCNRTRQIIPILFSLLTRNRIVTINVTNSSTNTRTRHERVTDTNGFSIRIKYLCVRFTNFCFQARRRNEAMGIHFNKRKYRCIFHTRYKSMRIRLKFTIRFRRLFRL